ncbi:hypothetical protein SF23_06930 [Streptomyces sp. MBRL 10]|nr:hypothetical protein SF23_06930 [Streptomyces sp. MBRL 10]
MTRVTAFPEAVSVFRSASLPGANRRSEAPPPPEQDPHRPGRQALTITLRNGQPGPNPPFPLRMATPGILSDTRSHIRLNLI